MTEVENILISLDHRHAQNIYAGTKKVELRRRALHVNAGDIVWIYEKVPVGSITGSASITAVHIKSPAKLWRQFGAVSGLTKAEFFEYFAGQGTACALELSGAHRIPKPLPPQFFLRLQAKQPILAALQTASPDTKRILHPCIQPSTCALT